MTVSLAYTNIFTADIDKLATFYSTLFDLEEIEASRSAIFRGFRTAGASIGFSAPDAFDLLGLVPQTEAGDRVMQTFDAPSRDAVHSLSRKACDLGASLVKEPFETYYGWYQAVLRDPDGNCFRINHIGSTNEPQE